LAGGAPTKQFKEENLAAKPAAPPAESAPLALETAAADNKYAYYSDEFKKTITNSQRYAQVLPSGNKKAKAVNKVSPAQNLLVSFQLEQNGRDLRILDDDGSVYNGYLLITNAAMRVPVETTDKSTDRFYRQRAIEAELRDQAGQNVTFHVSGTNRSLKQQVIFTGTLLPTTNATFLSNVTNSFDNRMKLGTENLSIQNGDLRTLQWLNTTISGKAQVGTQKEIEIKAVPVAR